MTEELQMIKNGMRIDGRKLDQIRPMEAKIGVLSRADGSAMFRFGNTWALAGVYGPRKVHPRHEEKADTGIIRTEYRMASFSTYERSKPGKNRRAQEISLVTRNALMPVLFLEEFPRTSIDVVIEILQADASTRCAGINATVLALADAGIPMRDLISSCSAGKIENTTVLDIAGVEDTEGELDMPIAYYPKKNQVTLLQMDGLIDPKEMKEVIQLAIKGCEDVGKVQQAALKSKYQETN